MSGVLTGRRAAILEAVRSNGAVSVAELAARFSVTQQTIRRDLHILDSNGLIQKGFGGAFAAPGRVLYGYQERQSEQAGVKKKLVMALEEFFTDNATVFVVNKTNPAVDAADFVKRSRAAGGPVPIGSSGVGSIPHLTLEMFADATKANVMHVPYKGAAPVINDLLGNQVAGFFGDVPGLISLIKSGQLKALGLAAPARLPQLPHVATLAEQGITGVQTNNWYGLLAPAAMPPALVDKLNADVRAALQSPDVRERLAQLGCQAAPTSPQELAALIASDRQKWSDLIKRKNIHMD